MSRNIKLIFRKTKFDYLIELINKMALSETELYKKCLCLVISLLHLTLQFPVVSPSPCSFIRAGSTN